MKGIKTFFIIAILSILLSIFVKSECLSISSLFSNYYSFDNTDYSGNNLFDLSSYNANGTITGVNMERIGKIEQSGYLDGNDKVTITQDFTGTGVFTVGGWIKFNSTEDYQQIFEMGTSGNAIQWYMTDTNYEISCGYWGIASTNAKKILNNNKWYHIVCVYSGGNTVKMYINGTLIGTDTFSYNVGIGGEVIGSRYNGASAYFKGIIDEFFISKSAMNITNIQKLYNSGIGCNPYISTVFPSFVLNKGVPNNNMQSKINLKFNYSGTPTDTRYNNYLCKIFQNNVNILNQSPTDIRQSQNFTLINNMLKNTIVVNCTNTNTSQKVTWYNITIDKTEPTINISYPLANIFIDYTTDLKHNITFNDSNFDGYRIQYYRNVSGVQTRLYSKESLNMNGGIYRIVNITNSSVWCTSPPCKIVLNITAWDSHNPINTINEKVKNIEKSDKYLKLEFKNGYIKISSNDTKSFNAYDSNNKYKIDFTLNKNIKDSSLLLESDNLMYYKVDSKHKSHFVFPYMLKYFDLDNDGLKINDIKQISKNKYQIFFNSNNEEIKTNSIGDLNINRKYVHFTLYELPDLNTLLLTDINNSAKNISNTTSSINLNIISIYEAINMIGLSLIFLVLLCIGIFTIYKIFLIFDSFILLVLGSQLISISSGFNKTIFQVLTFLCFLFMLLYGVIKSFQQVIQNRQENKSKGYKESFK